MAHHVRRFLQNSLIFTSLSIMYCLYCKWQTGYRSRIHYMWCLDIFGTPHECPHIWRITYRLIAWCQEFCRFGTRYLFSLSQVTRRTAIDISFEVARNHHAIMRQMMDKVNLVNLQHLTVRRFFNAGYRAGHNKFLGLLMFSPKCCHERCSHAHLYGLKRCFVCRGDVDM